MKKFILVCTLAALASPALAGNDGVAVMDSREQMQLISEYNRQMDSLGMRMNDASGLHPGGRGAPGNSLAMLRRNLAVTWQGLGLSPADARKVASAYRPQLSPNVPRVSSQDKTDEQFAALIQSSLVSKNYQLADETLIDFITKKMKPGRNVSSADRKR